MYVNKKIAEVATALPADNFSSQGSESHADIVRSVRETLANFEVSDLQCKCAR